MDLFADPVELPGIRYHPNWLPQAEAETLFKTLHDSVAWEVHRIQMFGRWVDSPRLSCWMGDEGAAYRYSGARYQPRPWQGVLDDLRRRLEAECSAPFNSVLATLYRDGRDAMGWHRDDEPELGVSPLIASISLGATRRFLLKDAEGGRHALDLANGDLLLMSDDSQRRYRHALPRTAKPVGARINLTFRYILPVAG